MLFRKAFFQLCITTDILNEYAEKLAEKFRPEVGDNVMKAIENSPDIVYVHKYYFWNLITVDPDDNKFVDCAVSANADFICTEDKHFNVLAQTPFPVVDVISANEFLARLSLDEFLAMTAEGLV